MPTTVDITPHPRILQVLGEIEFKPWQCIAELIDNSVDEFLRSQRAGIPVNLPMVQVAFGRDTVVVKDNGPGMTLESLEMAVKAGWTSNERIGNLGLYGVGFNIATARLGNLIRIWTTRAGDQEWFGLELDLKKMARGGTYILDVKTRLKTSRDVSGTEVVISNIREDWKALFLNDTWIRHNIKDRLARIYGTMLRDLNPQPIKFSLQVNNRKVSAWEHCVYPSEWAVFKKSEGDVRPIIEIDETYGKKYLSVTTGEFFDSNDGLNIDEIIEVPERIYGWIGIQRYADENDYGIDILRYGRKIEIGNKDIFKWEDSNGNLILEYPIDDPRQRGRIVGEIHLDHGYVHYTKHRFEREHSSWGQLLLAVRNNEPLTKRESMGYNGVNTSPLGILFRTFRRNSPSSGQKWRDILFIKDNETAKKWAEKFRKGNSDYLTLDKWEDAFKELDDPKLTEEGETDNGFDPEQNDLNVLLVDETDSTTSISDKRPDPNEISRFPIPEFSFRVTDIGVLGRTYNFETFTIEPFDDSSNSPWRSRATARGIYEIEVVRNHPAFKSTSLRVIDAVLAEMAYIISSEEISSVGITNTINYGDILFTLRTRYSFSDSLDANRLLLEVEEIRKNLIKCLSQSLSEEKRSELLEEISQDDLQKVELAQARGPENTSAVEYLDMSNLAQIAEKKAHLFFEAGCFNKQWVPPTLEGKRALLEIHQKRLFQDIWIPMFELGNFTKQITQISEMSLDYLSLIRACINRLKEFSTNQTNYAQYF